MQVVIIAYIMWHAIAHESPNFILFFSLPCTSVTITLKTVFYLLNGSIIILLSMYVALFRG